MVPGVSIIIPTLNEEGYLPRLLESLKGISSPLDIIVVDGASTDSTCALVSNFQSQFAGNSTLTLLESKDRGIALQRNMGARAAQYETLAFCDADIVMPSVSNYEKLMTEFSEEEYVVAAPALKPLEPGIHRKVIYYGLLLAQKIILLLGKPYFPGACLLTTKKVFEQVGGFDTNIVLGEDVDYSLRAGQQGSFGLLNVKIVVSDRRFMKYGYGWILSEIPNVIRLVITGRIKPETIFYPFGEYGGQEPHHVTNNRGA